MSSAFDFIQDLQAQGRYSFTQEEAERSWGGSATAVRAALRRLKAKRVIADPYRGFHVIITPEYRRLGCLPADHFVPQLMKHLGEPYYVGLLSAAAYHGASHQAPMVFQLIVERPRRAVVCGDVQVAFVSRHDMSGTPVIERNTATGTIRVATAEATALELVGYSRHCGYLNNVATVLADLAERMRGEELAREARRAPLAWVQRLGFLLCLVGEDDLADHLDPIVTERAVYPVPLAVGNRMKGALRDPRWLVIVNADVESDR